MWAARWTRLRYMGQWMGPHAVLSHAARQHTGKAATSPGVGSGQARSACTAGGAASRWHRWQGRLRHCGGYAVRHQLAAESGHRQKDAGVGSETDRPCTPSNHGPAPTASWVQAAACRQHPPDEPAVSLRACIHEGQGKGAHASLRANQIAAPPWGCAGCFFCGGVGARDGAQGFATLPRQQASSLAHPAAARRSQHALRAFRSAAWPLCMCWGRALCAEVAAGRAVLVGSAAGG